MKSWVAIKTQGLHVSSKYVTPSDKTAVRMKGAYRQT